MKIRQALRWAVAAGAVAATVAVPGGVALAETPAEWTPSESPPWTEIIGLYVGVPVALFLLIAVLVMAPSLIRGSGYRPGHAWWSEPLWFGPTPVPAKVDASEAGSTPTRARGGAGASW